MVMVWLWVWLGVPIGDTHNTLAVYTHARTGWVHTDLNTYTEMVAEISIWEWCYPGMVPYQFAFEGPGMEGLGGS